MKGPEFIVLGLLLLFAATFLSIYQYSAWSITLVVLGVVSASLGLSLWLRNQRG